MTIPFPHIPALAACLAPFAFAADPFPVAITVDAGRPLGPLKPVWRFFGADEPNFAPMKDGTQLLAELGELRPRDVYFRAHHLLTSGDGKPGLKWGSTNAYTEDAQGNPVYDWTITDRIFDTYLQRGVKPYVQLGFIPEALSIHPQDYPHHPPADIPLQAGCGFSYPPKDYGKWGGLCSAWAAHCATKYGKDEASRWWWEVWNEPNISYWKGTPADYHKLYDYATGGVRKALPDARIGGPETAGGPGGSFLRDFLEHCLHGHNEATGGTGAPLDFISFHAKGSPTSLDGHVRMGISSQLRNANDAFKVISSFPELAGKPVVIGESDPEGCAACRGPQLAYRNGTMYSSYTAASFPRMLDLAALHSVNLEGVLTWAFEFENQPYFAGFRVLASNGVDLPVLNVFRMFSKMSGQRILATSDHAIPLDEILHNGVRTQPDVAALASRDNKRIAILIWHYHDDDVPGPPADVSLLISGLPEAARDIHISEFRVDETNSNSFTAWKAMGTPQQPTPAQHEELAQAGKLAVLRESQTSGDRKGPLVLHTTLPRQAVGLLLLDYP